MPKWLFISSASWITATIFVAPSLTVTEMGKRLSKAVTGPDDIHALDARYPFGHVSTPEDVAAAVTFLVSGANTYANGQKINIDGGGGMRM